jgi:long-subunit fatty acid transport protein
MKLMKKLFFTCTLILNLFQVSAQGPLDVITTAVPFLQIAADARAAGMGEMGVATSPDVYSAQWNPAKLPFYSEEYSVGISYTPYLVELANDIALMQLNYTQRINERSAVSANLIYFSLGQVELREDLNSPVVPVRPNEFAFNAHYSLKLSERFAMAVGGKFIRSQLRFPSAEGDATAASSFAFDIAGYYQSEEIPYSDFSGRWRLGFNLQNMGPKLSYDNDRNPINASNLPTNFKFGGGFDFIFDEYNKVSLNSEFNKLMVPTPNGYLNPDGSFDRDGYKAVGWLQGMFSSFGDAQGGFAEELREITWALGAEYMYQDAFAFRAGYFNESETKGARQFITIGAGFKYNVVKLDVSYLFGASKVRNPLENTLRFSLTLNFGDKDKYVEY